STTRSPAPQEIPAMENQNLRRGRFQIEDLEERIAPAITIIHVNGGGNTPNGQANGGPTGAEKPPGPAPPVPNPHPARARGEKRASATRTCQGTRESLLPAAFPGPFPRGGRSSLSDN